MTDVSGDLTAALITANTTGAIAVIRITGRNARKALDCIFTPTSNPSPVQDDSRLLFGCFADDTGTIDEGLISFAESENEGAVVDINVHGGQRITERILAALARAGCKLNADDPIGDSGFGLGFGDWTIERETKQALACCQTRRAVRFVAKQADRLKQHLARIAKQPDTVKIEELMSKSSPGLFLINGASVAIIGPPNAGKSTLINTLADRSETLVSPEPGTTRDWTEVAISIDGVPIRLIDTAGIRGGADDLEREAMRRGLVQSHNADVQLLVLDRSNPLPVSFLDDNVDLLNSARLIVVANKTDLPNGWSAVTDGLSAAASWTERLKRPIEISGRTGDGVPVLSRRISDVLGVDACNGDGVMLFTRRQVGWLETLPASGNVDRIREALLRYVGD